MEKKTAKWKPFVYVGLACGFLGMAGSGGWFGMPEGFILFLLPGLLCLLIGLVLAIIQAIKNSKTRAAGGNEDAETSEATSQGKRKSGWLSGVLIAVALFVVLAAFGSRGTAQSNPAVSSVPSVIVTESAIVETAEPVVEGAPTPDPTAEVAELASPAPDLQEQGEKAAPAAEDPLTMGQKNAIRTAQDYLKYTAFSRTGLIGQLEYEGYSHEDAEFAVYYITVDWFEQAAQCAEDYLKYSAFSRDGLIDQLEYEGFTREQAEYAVTQVGY